MVMAVSRTRVEACEAFMDAAERLLIEMSWSEVTVRRLATEAGLNHGLVHYYFGSMEELFVQVLERFTSRLIERQRAMYSGDAPFIEKWRSAVRYLDEDRESGYQKIWYELQSMAWNRPELRARVASVDDAWRSLLTEAFSTAMKEYGIDRRRFPVEAVVALVITFNEGIILERLSGISTGHEELLTTIDRWLQTLERQRKRAK
jgi:TetR/AcrR family transcriptional regulator